MKKLRILILLLLSFLLLVGCGGNQGTTGQTSNTNNGTEEASEKKQLRLGLISSTTGRGAAYGMAQDDATALAIEEINNNGGIDGIEILAFHEDDQTDPSKGVTVAKKLIEQDKVDVIVGSSASLVTLAFTQVNQQAKVPLVNAMAGSPKITDEGYEYVWRVGYTDLYLDEKAVEHLIENDGHKSFAFLVENSDYGVPPTEAASKKVEELGGTVLAYETYNPGETDFKAQLSKIKDLSPDVIFTHGYYTEGSIIARQIRELGIQAQLVVNQGQGVETFAELAREAAEGVIFPTSWLPNEDERSKAFEEAFRAKYNREPGGFEVSSYETIYVVAEAVRKGGGTSSEQIQEGLKQINGLETLMGPLNFNEKNQNESEVKLGIFRNGKIEIYH